MAEDLVGFIIGWRRDAEPLSRPDDMVAAPSELQGQPVRALLKDPVGLFGELSRHSAGGRPVMISVSSAMRTVVMRSSTVFSAASADCRTANSQDRVCWRSNRTTMTAAKMTIGSDAASSR